MVQPVGIPAKKLGREVRALWPPVSKLHEVLPGRGDCVFTDEHARETRGLAFKVIRLDQCRSKDDLVVVVQPPLGDTTSDEHAEVEQRHRKLRDAYELRRRHLAPL